MSDARTDYTNALRQFADWLDANPQYDAPASQKLLVPLSTNPAVREFADRHGLEVAMDAEGNLSAEIKFGPIAYHVYGYVDFEAHVAAKSERDARTWAGRNGLEIVAKTSN
jgi:hypothetical protein